MIETVVCGIFKHLILLVGVLSASKFSFSVFLLTMKYYSRQFVFSWTSGSNSDGSCCSAVVAYSLEVASTLGYMCDPVVILQGSSLFYFSECTYSCRMDFGHTICKILWKKWCYFMVWTAGDFAHYKFVFCLHRKWNLSKSGFDGMTMLVCDQVCHSIISLVVCW